MPTISGEKILLMFLSIIVYFGSAVKGLTLTCSETLTTRAVATFLIQSLPKTLHFSSTLEFNHTATPLHTSVP